ncbi:hypothetical protein [Saccharopolyspora taberi]|uniref:DUF3043 domain-containing protein n=1 Tax=Saccharopolyspora taberi TaxID=60895 RepID=A0ABN3V417_9PSEU
MRIRTDDEIYRVDAVWLGPPKATFPWRARYVAWGVGIVVFLLVLAIERRMNIGFSFFSTAWAVVITIVVTRIICARITHERPLGAVLVMWMRELTAPREKTATRGGAATAARIRVRTTRPRPKQKQPRRPGRGNRQQQVNRSRQPARGQAPRKRARSKEVRGVRSTARP